jgi:mono/diheme cytochrome c family protein
MWADRAGIVITAVIVVLLAGATVAVYAYHPVEGQPAAVDSVDGRTVFLTKGCTGCHTINGVSETAQIGPNLTDLSERAGDRLEGLSAEEYVRQSVLDPRAYIVDGYGELMPTLPLDTEELDALVAFLLSER